MTYFLIVIRQIAQFILFAGIGVIAAKTKTIPAVCLLIGHL